MTKRILVPLDQSPLAESVLSLVADVARGAGATVRLLHVTPVPGNVEVDGRVVAYADQEMARLEAEGKDYLQSMEVRLAGVPVECVVRFGTDVREILLEAEAFGADLIAVTTAGRSGVGRAVLGSVAEQVFRKATLSVLLYRAGNRGE
ncbi:MAG: universal stress protein [Candidatus Rokubacteria bacterium]|nr:universal stress protein [Candidatus Rokubacteria bacterium]